MFLPSFIKKYSWVWKLEIFVEERGNPTYSVDAFAIHLFLTKSQGIEENYPAMFICIFIFYFSLVTLHGERGEVGMIGNITYFEQFLVFGLV